MENILKSLIVLNGKSIPQVANMMNLSKSSLYRKIHGTSEFTRKEITELIDILHIDPYKAMEIFFDIKVS